MKRERGITLIEVIITIAIIGIIMLVVSNFTNFGFKSHKLTADEFAVQSNLRLLSQNINGSVRDASAVFALHKEDDSVLTDGWNYIMVSDDNQSVTRYEWDESEEDHVERDITDRLAGTTFSLEYRKNNSSDKDKLIKYTIVANVNGREREIESELEALNSLQVIDRGSTTNPSNALAYRTDPRPGEISDSQAAVAMVLDRSGSMAWKMNGDYGADDNSENLDDHSRMKKMKDEVNRLMDALAKNPNIYISINSFAENANGPRAMIQAQTNVGEDDEGNDFVLTADINTMVANGATNTGDGMRRGYHSIAKFNEGKTKTIKNFMIILVDGETNRSSIHKYDSDDFLIADGNVADPYEVKSTKYTEYVTEIGDEIEIYNNEGETIKTYVIGFNADKVGGIEHIANATGAEGPSEEQNYFEAGSSEALEEIFDLIKKEIDDSLWHIGGPS